LNGKRSSFIESVTEGGLLASLTHESRALKVETIGYLLTSGIVAFCLMLFCFSTDKKNELQEILHTRKIPVAIKFKKCLYLVC